MRHGYIRCNNYDQSGGCRGGISSNYDGPHEEYELEIGQSCNSSNSMLAFCCMIDEIKEFLDRPSPLMGNLIKDKLKQIEKDFEDQYLKSVEARDANDEKA